MIFLPTDEKIELSKVNKIVDDYELEIEQLENKVSNARFVILVCSVLMFVAGFLLGKI